MDKETVLGFVLIMLVLLVWMWLQAPPPPSPQAYPQDSLQAAQSATKEPAPVAQPLSAQQGEQEKTGPESAGKYFAHLVTGVEKILVVKTDLYTAEITTKGGLIRKWELHKYLAWDKVPVQLVDFDGGGDWSILFTSADGKRVNTR